MTESMVPADRGLRDGTGAAGEGVELKDAHGPVPGHGSSPLRSLSAKSLADPGPISAHLVVGDRVDLDGDGCGRVGPAKLGATTTRSTGRDQVNAAFSCLRDIALTVSIWSSSRDFANRVALSGQEGATPMPPPMKSMSAFFSMVRDDARPETFDPPRTTS